MRDRRNGAKGRVEAIKMSHEDENDEMNTGRKIGIEIPIGRELMANIRRKGS